MITGDAVGTATHGERFAAHALAAQRARRRMFVHEEARAVDRARAVELPELAQRRRLARRVILQRLRVRAHRAPLGVEHAHRVGNDVEDRFELRDVATQRLTQLFSFADVVAGEENSAPAALVDERGERRLDQPPSAAMLERDAHRVVSARRAVAESI